jgi:outer membrane protein assembly factor BamB
MRNNHIYWGTDLGAVVRYDHVIQSVNGNLKLSDYQLGHGTVYEGMYYLSDNQGVLYAVSLKDFKLQWKLETGKKSIAAPVHDGTSLWIAAQDGTVLKISPAAKTIISSKSYEEYFNTPPLVLLNVLIFAAHSGNLIIVDKENLNVIQRLNVDARMKLIPVIFKGFLITGFDSGIISVYKINTGI